MHKCTPEKYPLAHVYVVQVFERWMEWEPDEQAWHSYIKMELRYKELDRARNIYERFVQVEIYSGTLLIEMQPPH